MAAPVILLYRRSLAKMNSWLSLCRYFQYSEGVSRTVYMQCSVMNLSTC